VSPWVTARLMRKGILGCKGSFAKRWGGFIKKVCSGSFLDLAATTEWYLTVRCTNPTCARLIAFQKARSSGGTRDVQLVVTGKLSVDCPHCKMLVRFQREQIERRQIVLIQ